MFASIARRPDAAFAPLVHHFETSRLLTTKDWVLSSKSARRVLVSLLLFACYAAFGTILWAAYVELDRSPRRALPVEAEPAQHTLLVPEDAWRSWDRHQAGFRVRVEDLLQGRTPLAERSAAGRAEAPPPRPALKPLGAALASIGQAPETAASPAGLPPIPSLKPADPSRYLLAASPLRETEWGSFWSGVAALFDASRIARPDRDNGREQHAEAARSSSANQPNGGEASTADARTQSRSDRNADSGDDRSDPSRSDGGRSDGSRGVGSDRDRSDPDSSDERDDDDRSSGNDRDRADRGGSDERGDRGHSAGNDRGRDGDGSSASSDRDRGGRGGRGDRGRGDRDRGRD